MSTTIQGNIIEHNLNHEVHVKLTPYGLDLWRATRMEVYSNRWRNRHMTPEDYAGFLQSFQTELDQHHVGDGWYKFQAWKLWGLFGKYFNETMGIASRLPFETTMRYVTQGSDPGEQATN